MFVCHGIIASSFNRSNLLEGNSHSIILLQSKLPSILGICTSELELVVLFCSVGLEMHLDARPVPTGECPSLRKAKGLSFHRISSLLMPSRILSLQGILMMSLNLLLQSSMLDTY